MERREFLRRTLWMALGSGWGATSLSAQRTRSASHPPEELTITPETTLTDVLNHLKPFTPAVMQMSEEDKRLAQYYRFPPYLHGHALSCKSVPEALRFLCGRGWEGSRLPEEWRAQLGANYQLARMPYVNGLTQPDEPRYWACNNPMWAWRWEKRKGGPAGGVLTIYRRVKDDGDVVATRPFKIQPLTDELALATLLDWIRQKQGIVVNVEGYPFAPVEIGRDRQGRPITRLEALRVKTLRRLFGRRLEQAHTIGEWLHFFAAGLNVHTRTVGGDWKWSSFLQRHPQRGLEMVIYTLRDYAHPPR